MQYYPQYSDQNGADSYFQKEPDPFDQLTSQLIQRFCHVHRKMVKRTIQINLDTFWEEKISHSLFSSLLAKVRGQTFIPNPILGSIYR